MITYQEKNWTTFGSLFENIGKQNGDEYEPNTLTSILHSFDRFLRDKEKYFSILTDIQFAEVEEALFFKAEANAKSELKPSDQAQLSLTSRGRRNDMNAIHHKACYAQSVFKKSYSLARELVTNITE